MESACASGSRLPTYEEVQLVVDAHSAAPNTGLMLLDDEAPADEATRRAVVLSALTDLASSEPVASGLALKPPKLSHVQRARLELSPVPLLHASSWARLCASVVNEHVLLALRRDRRADELLEAELQAELAALAHDEAPPGSAADTGGARRLREDATRTNGAHRTPPDHH